MDGLSLLLMAVMTMQAPLQELVEADDISGFRACVTEYRNNRALFECIDLKYRVGYWDNKAGKILTPFNESLLDWNHEHHLKISGNVSKHHYKNLRENTLSTVLNASNGRVTSDEQCSFYKHPTYDFQKIIFLDLHFYDQPNLDEMLQQCLDGESSLVQIQEANVNPAYVSFLIDNRLLVTFDRSHGSLPVFIRLTFPMNGWNSPHHEIELSSFHRSSNGGWFPQRLERETKWPGSDQLHTVFVCEALEWTEGQETLDSPLHVMIPAGAEFRIDGKRTRMIFSHRFNAKDFESIPSIFLWNEFYVTLFSRPLELPEFLQKNPQAWWIVVPDVCVLLLVIGIVFLMFQLRKRSFFNRSVRISQTTGGA